MAGTTDFVPFATGSSANVESQANYIAPSTTTNGYQTGTASSAFCNKSWRQSSFIAAGIATFVANQLSINVADDGNLTNFVTNFASALDNRIAADLSGYATETWVNAQGFATESWVNSQGFATETWVQGQGFATTTFASNASNLSTGTLATARLNLAATLEALMLSSAVTLQADPGTTPASGTAGSIIAYY